MSEFITIQVGQCGNQIGTSFWSLALQEYGVQKRKAENGRNSLNVGRYDLKETDSLNSFFLNSDNVKSGSLCTFADLKESRIKARAVLIDMEDSVLSRLHNGSLGSIFDNKCTVANYPGSGNNWAEGHLEHGAEYHERILEAIQRGVDRCDSLHGFLLLFSVGGGTGSGLGTYVLKMLEDNFPHIDRFVSCVYPYGTEDVIVGPYNALLATNEIIEHATCAFPAENKALFEIVDRCNKTKSIANAINNFPTYSRTFQDVNSIIVRMLLNLTSGSRFPGSLNVDMNDLSTNMVPYPNMHFISSGLSPLVQSMPRVLKDVCRKAQCDTFLSSCSRNNQIVRLDPLGLNSVLLGSALIGRGDFNVSDMRNFVERLQTKGHFTPWSRKSIKIGLCSTPPSGHNVSMLSLFNTTAITDVLTNVHAQYAKLYRKRAHVHHYTRVNGFCTDHFRECEENVLSTIDNYKEVESMKAASVPRLKIA